MQPSQTLFLDGANDLSEDDEAIGEEEEKYEPEFDNDRIAKLLERSQRAIQRCQVTISNVEHTQEHMREVHVGCQETL